MAAAGFGDLAKSRSGPAPTYDSASGANTHPIRFADPRLLKAVLNDCESFAQFILGQDSGGQE